MIKKISLIVLILIFITSLFWYYSLLKSEYKEKWIWATINAIKIFSVNKNNLSENILIYWEIVDIIQNNNIHNVFLEKNKEIIIDSKSNINKDQEKLILNFMVEHWIEWILNQNFNPSIFTEWIFFKKWSIKYERNNIKGYLYYDSKFPRKNENNYNSSKMTNLNNNWLIIE
jgi:hypothetical protein